MRTLIILLLLALGGGGAWWYFSDDKESGPDFVTAKVVRGDLTQIVTATGILNPVVNVQVSSQISGNIKKLYVDFNSPVEAGQMIAQLDDATYKAVKNQAEGDMASAQAALELAQLTAKRKKELVAQNAAPQADLDSAEAALNQAKAALQIKQAQLEKAEVDLARCTISSPVKGTVISRDVDVGQTVAASMNAPILFRIANDLTKMQINTAVAEADVGVVKEGQEVEFTVDAFPYRTFRGSVTQVRNAATTLQNVVTYDVIVGVDNKELSLKPGMTANVSIIIAQRENVLKLPNAALRFKPLNTESGGADATAGNGRDGGKPSGRGGRPKQAGTPERTVYVPGSDGKTRPVTVKVGITDSIHTEVLEGLDADAEVITGVDAPAAYGQRTTNPLGGGGSRWR